MALTNPFDTATPAGSDNPTAGDDRIRELKDAIVEREGQDHYWPDSGTVYDDDDCGLHSKVSLLVQGADASAKANAIVLYGKDVGGKCEAHLIDEDSNVVQLTSAGEVNAASEFVTGDLLFSSVTTAHTGWTNVTATYANRHIRVGNTELGTGGSATLAGATSGHTLQESEIPAHTHSYDAHSGGSTTGNGGNSNINPDGDTTGSKGGGGSHSHALTSVANTPLYVDVRVFKKD